MRAADEAINRGISRLRKMLGGKRDSFIKTIPKQGYQFSLPVNVSFVISDELAAPDVNINDDKIEKTTATQSQSVTPTIEQLPHTPNENSRLCHLRHLRHLAFIASFFICLVLTLILWPKEQANTAAKDPDTKAQNQKPNKIPLAVKPFTRQANQ